MRWEYLDVLVDAAHGRWVSSEGSRGNLACMRLYDEGSDVPTSAVLCNTLGDEGWELFQLFDRPDVSHPLSHDYRMLFRRSVT